MELCEIEEDFDKAIDIYNKTKDAIVYLSRSSFFCAIKQDTDNLEAEFNRI